MESPRHGHHLVRSPVPINNRPCTPCLSASYGHRTSVNNDFRTYVVQNEKKLAQKVIEMSLTVSSHAQRVTHGFVHTDSSGA